MSTFAQLKRAAAQSTPINIVNSDIQIVETIQGAGDVAGSTNVLADTTPGRGPRPKFKPVDRIDTANGSPIEFAESPPSDNMDLIGDIEPVTKRTLSGRKRVFTTNAERQRAYRARKKSG